MKIEIHSSTPETRQWNDKSTGELRTRKLQTAYVFFDEEPYPTPIEVASPDNAPYKPGVYELFKGSFRVNSGRLDTAFGLPLRFVSELDKKS